MLENERPAYKGNENGSAPGGRVGHRFVASSSRQQIILNSLDTPPLAMHRFLGVRLTADTYSARARQVSWVAVFEFLAGTCTGFWIFLDGRWLHYFALAAIAAPFFLLRTRRSTLEGIRIYKRVSTLIDKLPTSPFDRFEKSISSYARPILKAMERWPKPILTIVWVAAGLFYLVAIIPLVLTAFVGVSAFFVATRAYATVTTAVRFPIRTIEAIPGNWVQQAFCTDIFSAPELIPGANRLRGKNPLHASHYWARAKDQRVPDPIGNAAINLFAVVVFGPVVISRLIFKATSVVWIPLLWCVEPLRQDGLTLDRRLERIRYRAISKLVVIWSFIVVALVTARIVLVAGANWASSTLGDAIAAAIYPWQLAALVAGVISIGVFFFADDQLARLKYKDSLPEKMIDLNLRVSLTVGRALALYAQTVAIFLLAREAHLLEHVHIRWQWLP